MTWRRRWRSDLGLVAIAALLFGCGAESVPAPGPAEARDSDTTFALVIRVGSPRYPANASIELVTSLTYNGPRAEVGIAHSGGGPVLVSLEQLDGPFDPGGGADASCARSTLTRAVPRIEPYRKSGVWDGNAPNAGQLRAWAADPINRLPPGTYRFTATAEFFEGDCPGPSHSLKASVDVVVGP